MAFEDIKKQARVGGRARCHDCGEEAAGRIQLLAQKYIRGEGRPVEHLATTSIPFCERHLSERWPQVNEALTDDPKVGVLR